MTIVEKVRKIIEKGGKKKSNFYGLEGLDHVLNVARYAKLLAIKRKADKEVTELAGLFHDYSCLLDKKYVDKHEEHSGKFAQEILSNLNYPQEKIEIIKDAIYCHRGSKNRPKKTLEAKCLADADAMAHFSEIPGLFYLAYVTYQMSNRHDAKNFVEEKLLRSWNKLSPDAQKIIQKQYEAAKIILK